MQARTGGGSPINVTADSADLFCSPALLSGRSSSLVTFISFHIQVEVLRTTGSGDGALQKRGRGIPGALTIATTKPPAMRAALLLLGLCGLAAASAIAPTAEDVRVTGRVPPIEPVGERSRFPALTGIVSKTDKSSASPVKRGLCESATARAPEILHTLLCGCVRASVLRLSSGCTQHDAADLKSMLNAQVMS